MITPIKPGKIPAISFEGWYWLSDSQKPELINGTFDTNRLKVGKSFILEAQLYHRDDISISIRYADGRHYITRYDLGQMDAEMKSAPRGLMGHRLEGRNLRVVDLWQEKRVPTGPHFAGCRWHLPRPDLWQEKRVPTGPANDAEEESMPMLVPMCTVFAGFEYN